MSSEKQSEIIIPSVLESSVNITNEAKKFIITEHLEELINRITPVIEQGMRLYRNPLGYSEHISNQRLILFKGKDAYSGGTLSPKVRIENLYPNGKDFGECRTIVEEIAPLMERELDSDNTASEFKLHGATGRPTTYFTHGGSQHVYFTLAKSLRSEDKKLAIDPSIGVIDVVQQGEGTEGYKWWEASVTNIRRPIITSTREGTPYEEHCILGISPVDVNKGCYGFNIICDNEGKLSANLYLRYPDGNLGHQFRITETSLPEVDNLDIHLGEEVLKIAGNIGKLLGSKEKHEERTYTNARGGD